MPQAAYPVMLDVRCKTCLIVGGGAVAARKLAALLEAGADVTVVSPQVDPSIQREVEARRVQWDQQHYQPGILDHYRPFLVFAATNSAATNQAISDEAQALGLLVNTAHQSGIGNFSNMAIIHRPPLTIGLHSGGMSPALTRHLKTVISEAIGQEYVILSQWLGELRATIRQQVSPQSRRQLLYETILGSDVLALLRAGQTAAARRRLNENL